METNKNPNKANTKAPVFTGAFHSLKEGLEHALPLLPILFISLFSFANLASGERPPVDSKVYPSIVLCYETHQEQLEKCIETPSDEDEFIKCVLSANDSLSFCLKLNHDYWEKYCLESKDEISPGYLEEEKECEIYCGQGPSSYNCMKECLERPIHNYNLCMGYNTTLPKKQSQEKSGRKR